MLNYNDITYKQIENAFVLLSEIEKSFYIKYSDSINNLFNSNDKMSCEYLEKLCEISRNDNNKILLSIVPITFNITNALNTIEFALNLMPNNKSRIISYIDYSFPKNHKNKYGIEYQNIFIFFITDNVSWLDNQEYVLHYLQKLDKLKMFI